MKKLYGTLIIFFYFVKYPYFFGLPILYLMGFEKNLYFNLFWIVCVLLILKDLFLTKKKKKD
ncbi:hypothetical protein [Candidatus Marinarcus aquaticus]|uniref:Uncharacterized protein n=1 Tax=Candidatus Marinarcus aquaticus TaxID=2044504 RepID=A0A4Q0XQY6_9BACT|nr:hypothetical protein [Candidatus Marinarcus aquaticus]RXJ58028.1 hypothetical protein CRV04_05850 [Candidatus Marinarcus aquaticus]